MTAAWGMEVASSAALEGTCTTFSPNERLGTQNAEAAGCGQHAAEEKHASEPTQLSEDIVACILSRLDAKDLLASARVCKSWRELAASPSIWASRYEADFHGRPFVSRLSSNEMGGSAVDYDSPDGSLQLQRAKQILGMPDVADWRSLYRRHAELEHNWRTGNSSCRSLVGHNDYIRCAQLHERTLVTASGSVCHTDCSIRVWDMDSGQETQLLRGHMGPVWCMVYDPSSNRVASGADDYSVRYWDVAAGHCVALQDPDSAVRCIHMDPGRRQLAAGTEFGMMLLWDCDVLEELMAQGVAHVEEELERSEGTRHAAASAAAAAAMSASATASCLSSMTAMGMGSGSSSASSMLCSSSSASSLAASKLPHHHSRSGSSSASTSTSNSSSSNCINSGMGGGSSSSNTMSTTTSNGSGRGGVGPPVPSKLMAAASNPKGPLAGGLVALHGRRVHVDGTGRAAVHESGADDSRAITAIQLQDGLCVSASAESLSRIQLWDVSQGSWRPAASVGDAAMVCARSMSFDKRLGMLVAGCGDKAMRVWDLESLSLRHTLPGHIDDILSHQFTETLLASAALNGAIRLWDVRSGQQVALLQHDTPVHAFQMQGDKLVSGTWDGNVLLWDLRSGSVVQQWSQCHNERVWAVCLDSFHCVTAALDKRIVVRSFAPEDVRFAGWQSQ